MSTDREQGVINDQRVVLNWSYASRRYPELIRRIRYEDAKIEKTNVLLTDNTALPARTITSPYQLLQILSVSIFKKIAPRWAFAKEGG